MKDNFSTQSDQYAKYRPTYPSELFDFLNSIVINKEYAWDCGTGNGQFAYELATTFENVFATDISQSQIDHAIQVPNYWDKERKYIDEHYVTIPFQFKEIKTPFLANEVQWTKEHLMGYLNTWSAVKQFTMQNNHNPVNDIRHSIEQYWGEMAIRNIQFLFY